MATWSDFGLCVLVLLAVGFAGAFYIVKAPLPGTSRFRNTTNNIATTLLESMQGTDSLLNGIRLTVGDVDAGAHSNVQIGFFGLIAGKDEKCQRIQQWLAPWAFGDDQGSRPDAQPNILKQHQDICAKGSGAWLTESTLEEWLFSQTANSLWIHGDVGSGKSILWYDDQMRPVEVKINSYRSSSAISCLAEKLQAGKLRSILALAICAYNLDYSYGSKFLLHSVLASLASVDPIPRELTEIYEQRNKFIHVDPKLTLRSILQGLDDSLVTPSRNFQRPSSLILVIDALDEAPKLNDRTAALQFLDELHELNTRLRVFKVRVVLFTRDDLQIRQHCNPENGWRIQPIQRQQINADIACAIHQRFAAHDKMSKLSPHERDELTRQITAKADGMFRLASLYLERLEQCNLTKYSGALLQRELKRLPDGLYPVYDHIIRKFGEGDIRRDLFAALRLVLYAAGPIFIEDATEFCATLPYGEDGELFDEDLRLHAYDLAQHLAGLISFSPPLPRGTSDLPAARVYRLAFAHFSVAEYLQQARSEQWRPSPDYFGVAEAQKSLALSCFAYLAYCHQQDDLAQHPFKRYAWRYWSRHAAAYLLECKDDHPTKIWIDERYAKSSDIRGDDGLTRPSTLALRLVNMLTVPELYPDEQISRHLGSELQKLCEGVAKLRGHHFTHLRNEVLSNPQYLEHEKPSLLAPRSDRHGAYEAYVTENSTKTPGVDGFLDSALKKAHECVDTITEDGFCLRSEILSNQYRKLEESILSLPESGWRGALEAHPAETPLKTPGTDSSMDAERLDQIPSATRFVVIEPAPFVRPPLRCWLLTDSLINRPRYTALSYSWFHSWNSRRSSRSDVYIGNNPVEVYENLRAALFRIRHFQSRQIFWIDALSVDMQDMNDRNHQISLMSDIYSSAHEVLTWLGEVPQTTMAIPALRSHASKLLKPRSVFSFHKVEVIESDTPDSGWDNIVERRCSSLCNSSVGFRQHCDEILIELFSSEVWGRAWLIQENALARQLFVQSGCRRISWGAIAAVAQASNGFKGQTLTSPLPLACANFFVLKSVRERADPPRLAELLWMSRHHSCSFPQDKFFSLIGLLQGEERRRCDELRDYGKSIKRTFAELAKIIIELNDSLDVLSMVSGVDGVEREEWPSWVPRWNECLPDSALAPGAFNPSQQQLFRAGSLLRGSMGYFDSTTDEMHAQGIKVGLVSNAFSGWSQPTWFEDVLNLFAMGAHSKPFQQRLPYLPSNFDIINQETFIRTLVEGRFLGQDKIFHRYRPESSRGVPLSRLYRQIELCRDRDRIIFQTTTGHVGSGPPNAREGDWIVVLLGAQVPFVVRSKPSLDGAQLNERFRLIGECYVDGIMDGEIVRELDSGKHEAKDIVLA